jgi:hypothetical protein
LSERIRIDLTLQSICLIVRAFVTLTILVGELG